MKVGDLFWEAEVRGVADAQEAGGGLQESFEGVAESAIGSATAQEQEADATRSNTEATEANERWTQRATTAKGLLSSALYFLSSNFGVASAAATVYSGAVGLATFSTSALTGAVGTLYATLVGPAALAGGLALATIGVGLLGSELLGLTDVTPVAEASMYSMKGTFADVAFLIGGPLVGFIGAGLRLLTGDFQGAKNMFVNTSVEWIKAAARFAAKVKLGFKTLGIGIRQGIAANMEAADYVWRAGLNTLLGGVEWFAQSASDLIAGGLQAGANAGVKVLNGVIAEANRVPGVDLDSISTVSIEGPDVKRTARVENTSLDDRLAGVRTRSMNDLAAAAEQARNEIEQFAPDTIGPDRRTRTGMGRRAYLPGENPNAVARRNRRRGRALGGGGGGGGQEPQKQIINVEIGDQSIDLSNLSRQERRNLASLIGDELGGQTGNISGIR